VKTVLLIEQQREHLESIVARHLRRLRVKRMFLAMLQGVIHPFGFQRRGLRTETDRVKALLKEVRAGQ
jgi:predicted xylose isomerase-like sugar epimerase